MELEPLLDGLLVEGLLAELPLEEPPIVPVLESCDVEPLLPVLLPVLPLLPVDPELCAKAWPPMNTTPAMARPKPHAVFFMLSPPAGWVLLKGR
jgi:hypothetical protein